MKFTEAQLETAIIELLGVQGYPHVLGEAIERQPQEGLPLHFQHVSMTDKFPVNSCSYHTMSNELIFYKTPDGEQRIEVVYEKEDFWMSQRALADLFSVKVPAISKHLKNIFESGELAEEQVISILETTTQHGAIAGKTQTQKVKFYSLDAIIAVGYRMNSYQATQFRIWATKTLKEFVIKGFVMDDERLKQGKQFGQDYFDELLERIREIRASERRFYQKITDIYALSTDYDSKAPITQEFFATVQNKLHWAITGKTAAETIHELADSKKPHMGLATWKGGPKGKVMKSDVSVAKNYLNEAHVKELNRIVSAYLDLAENRAERQITMNMADWVVFLNNFLELSSYPILEDKGKVAPWKPSSKQKPSMSNSANSKIENTFPTLTKKSNVGKEENRNEIHRSPTRICHHRAPRSRGLSSCLGRND